MKTVSKAVETSTKAKSALEVYKEKAITQVKEAIAQVNKGIFLF